MNRFEAKSRIANRIHSFFFNFNARSSVIGRYKFSFAVASMSLMRFS